MVVMVFHLGSAISIAGNDFDNWYFKYFGAGVDITRRGYNQDGAMMLSQTGKISQSLSTSSEPQELTIKQNLVNNANQEKFTSTTIWRKNEDGTYIGKYTDSRGTKADYRMAPLKKNSVQIEAQFPGYSVSRTGQLLPDGTYYANDVFRTRQGATAFIMTSETKPVAK